MAIANSAVFQITEGEWTSERYFDILGEKIPALFTSDPALLSEYISSFQTRPDDVFVVTYPKSGTTWVQEIIWQMYNEGAINSEHILKRVPFLETATSGMLPDPKTLPSPRLLKSHLSYNNTPKSGSKDKQCKYIYIARNPKDVAVSFFHFTKTLSKNPLHGYNGPWEFFLKLFMEGNVGWNFWNDHVLGWWEHRDDPNILFLKFEELKKDLPSHVRMIAEFLNKPLSEELNNRIADQCTFQGMTKNEAGYKMPEDKDSLCLLRKGVVGDWKNYFTPEQNERFEKEVMEKLKGSGLEFDFEI